MYSLRTTSYSRPVSGKLQGSSPPLPAIAEDRTSFHAGDPPPVPPRAFNRPANRFLSLGTPRLFVRIDPPAYSIFDPTGVLGPRGEKLSDVRNNKHIAKRGGWRTLCITASVVLLFIIGLVVGLVLGLRTRHRSSS